MGLIRTLLPKPLQEPALRLLQLILKPIFFGHERYCPICRSHVRMFKPDRTGRHLDSRCPVCGSNERFRFMWLFLDHRKDMFESSPCRILHFAPERIFEARYRQMPNVEYVSGDIRPDHAMVQMDITNIQYPANTFDIIHCSHVLEHVPEDMQAMRELCHVLAPGGKAIVMVPITAEATMEDTCITDPAERERVFGQYDHVRRYGLDIQQRLADAGFDVTCVSGQDFVEPEDITRMATRDEVIFLCRKP